MQCIARSHTPLVRDARRGWLRVISYRWAVIFFFSYEACISSINATCVLAPWPFRLAPHTPPPVSLETYQPNLKFQFAPWSAAVIICDSFLVADAYGNSLRCWCCWRFVGCCDCWLLFFFSTFISCSERQLERPMGTLKAPYIYPALTVKLPWSIGFYVVPSHYWLRQPPIAHWTPRLLWRNG